MYYTKYWKRDFSYFTKGISVDKKTGEGPELMLLGPVSYHAASNKYIMARPELVIGTDRLELYEHFARRREVLTAYNRNWLKLAVGLTLTHFVVVQVPTYFSKFFGDEVSPVELRLGSKDLSEEGLQMSRLKNNVNKRKELE